MPVQPESSFPDVVMLTARRSAEHIEGREFLLSVAQKLPMVKKTGFDMKTVRAVRNTYNLEPEEIIGHLTPDHLPFDRLWIQGPGKAMARDNRDFSEILAGAMVNKTPTGFDITMLTSHTEAYCIAAGMPPDIAKKVCVNGFFIAGNPSKVSVCNERGIVFKDEEKLLEAIESGNSFYQNSAREVKINCENSIDEIYNYADFLARIFILLGSPTLRGTVDFRRSPAEIDADRQAQKRLRMGAAPRFGVAPITVDLSDMGMRVLAQGTEKEKRLLLGWTDVRRSKEIVSKHGVKFFRDFHERRIPADDDRRKAWRNLTSRNPGMVLDIGDRGPVRRLEEPRQ